MWFKKKTQYLYGCIEVYKTGRYVIKKEVKFWEVKRFVTFWAPDSDLLEIHE